MPRKPASKPRRPRTVTAQPIARKPDVTIQGGSSIALIVPETDAGREWCEEHIVREETIRFSNGIACEPRYLHDVVEGLRSAGLTVEGI